MGCTRRYGDFFFSNNRNSYLFFSSKNCFGNFYGECIPEIIPLANEIWFVIVNVNFYKEVSMGFSHTFIPFSINFYGHPFFNSWGDIYGKYFFLNDTPFSFTFFTNRFKNFSYSLTSWTGCLMLNHSKHCGLTIHNIPGSSTLWTYFFPCASFSFTFWTNNISLIAYFFCSSNNGRF